MSASLSMKVNLPLLYIFFSMEWTEAHDVRLCREVLHDEPYQRKKGSNQRGEAWTQIAKRLSGSDELVFRVDQRGVRERMERLKTNYKAKMREEESASGITVEEISELDALICEIIERQRMAEEARESNANWKKNDADKKTAEEMRKVAMERYGETRKRSEEEDNTDKKVKRKKSGGDAVEFLREKAQMEKELRKEEIAIKKKGTGTRGCKAKYDAKHDAEHYATTTTTAAAGSHHDGSCGETVTR